MGEDGNTAVADPEEAVQAPGTLSEALLRAQGEAQELDLRRNESGAERGRRKDRYLTYPKLLEQVRPVLQRNLLTWNTFPTTLEVEGKLVPALRYQLTFTGVSPSESVGDTMLLATKENTSQAQGSGITYARRYSLLAVLDLAPDGDDDGEKASTVAPRPVPADPEAPLPEERYAAMCEAVAERGLSLERVLRKAGVSGELTVGDASKVGRVLKEHDAEQEG